MPRPRSRPLTLSLREAWEIAKQLYRDYAGEAGRESMSTITDNSPKSSTFRYKLLALKSFGLIDERNDDIVLTSTGYGLAAPTEPDEAIHAAARAFLEVPEYGEFHERYAGKLLPDRDRLPNILHRELGIDKDYAEAWAISLQDDLETANLLARRGNQLLVLSAPETTPTQIHPLPGIAPTVAPVPSVGPRAAADTVGEDYQTLKITLSGGQGVVSVPKKVTASDVSRLVGLIRALGPSDETGVSE